MDINIFKRIFILLALPFIVSVGVLAFYISIPMWVLTGKEISKKTCDGMLTAINNFLNN